MNGVTRVVESMKCGVYGHDYARHPHYPKKRCMRCGNMSEDNMEV